MGFCVKAYEDGKLRKVMTYTMLIEKCCLKMSNFKSCFEDWITITAFIKLLRVPLLKLLLLALRLVLLFLQLLLLLLVLFKDQFFVLDNGGIGFSVKQGS